MLNIDPTVTTDFSESSKLDEGFMDKNFGIAFFIFDRFFGTLASDPPVFNERGYAAALRRFGELLRSPGVRSCGKRAGVTSRDRRRDAGASHGEIVVIF
jgi:hypothetical protein